MLIACKGTRITTIINGVTIADYDGAARLDDQAHRSRHVGRKGHIGLQIRAGKQILTRFQEIEVREDADPVIIGARQIHTNGDFLEFSRKGSRR